MNIMLHISKIADHLKTLTEKEVKNFVVINSGEYVKPAREKFYSKLSEEKYPLTTRDEVKKMLS